MSSAHLLIAAVATRWLYIITLAGGIAAAAATGSLAMPLSSDEVSRAFAKGLLLCTSVFSVWLCVSAATGRGSQQGSGPAQDVEHVASRARTHGCELKADILTNLLHHKEHGCELKTDSLTSLLHDKDMGVSSKQGLENMLWTDLHWTASTGGLPV